MPPATTRAANMERRRERILASARSSLARDGIDALTVRRLAKDAGVTVPTLYNLIGSKDDILRRLIEDMVMHCERVLEGASDRDPLTMAERVVEGLAGLFREDEDFCRAALLAGQRLDPSGGGELSPGLLARSAQIARQICIKAKEQGLLRGEIDTVRLAERAFDNYRIATIDWLHGVIDADGFRRNALQGFFICLAADARRGFRNEIMRRIQKLDRETKRRPARQSSAKKRARTN